MNNYLKWIIPIACILIGFVAGIIVDKFVFKKLNNLANRRLYKKEIIFLSLQGIPKFWFFVAGFYGAVIILQLDKVISETLASNLQKVLSAIFLYTVVIVLARLVASFVTLISQTIEGLSTSLISNLARIIVFVFGILMILETLGFSITPIIATLGIGGLAMALAFQETLSNLFSGLYLLISKQVRPGDYVKLETGQEGYVTDITWRNTVIKEIPHNEIIIPNTKLASAIFTNYHLPAKEITVTVDVSVSYDSDLEKVERVTIEVAKQVMQEMEIYIVDFEPFILYQKFGEFSVDLKAFMRVGEFLEQREIKHKFIKRLHRRYKEEGIKIPFPVREIYTKEKRE